MSFFLSNFGFLIIFLYISLTTMRQRTTKKPCNIQSKKKKQTGRSVTLRKWLGTRLHKTGVRNWTCSLGGHCAIRFFFSLLNRPADRGITFWKYFDNSATTNDNKVVVFFFYKTSVALYNKVHKSCVVQDMIFFFFVYSTHHYVFS